MAAAALLSRQQQQQELSEFVRVAKEQTKHNCAQRDPPAAQYRCPYLPGEDGSQHRLVEVMIGARSFYWRMDLWLAAHRDRRRGNLVFLETPVNDTPALDLATIFARAFSRPLMKGVNVRAIAMVYSNHSRARGAGAWYQMSTVFSWRRRQNDVGGDDAADEDGGDAAVDDVGGDAAERMIDYDEEEIEIDMEDEEMNDPLDQLEQLLVGGAVVDAMAVAEAAMAAGAAAPANNGAAASANGGGRNCVVCQVGVSGEHGVDYVTFPCGTTYDKECFLAQLQSTGSSDLLCNCKTPAHVLPMTRQAARVASTARVAIMRMLVKATEKSRPNTVQLVDRKTTCRRCDTTILIGDFAEIYTCTNGGCYNPKYGYCAHCHAGIEDMPHRCISSEQEEAATLKWLAENGIHPCPGCSAAAVKLDQEHCNHIHCNCGTSYCALCGYTFPKNDRGTFMYAHNCHGNKRRGNYATPSAKDRTAIAQAYAELATAPPTVRR